MMRPSRRSSADEWLDTAQDRDSDRRERRAPARLQHFARSRRVRRTLQALRQRIRGSMSVEAALVSTSWKRARLVPGPTLFVLRRRRRRCGRRRDVHHCNRRLERRITDRELSLAGIIERLRENSRGLLWRMEARRVLRFDEVEIELRAPLEITCGREL